MNRVALIGLAMVIIITLAFGGLYLSNRYGQVGQATQPIPTGQRVVTNSSTNADISSFSNDPTLIIGLTDKDTVQSYLLQYGFWSKDIPYYNSVNMSLIGKFRMTSLIFVLDTNPSILHPFTVGNLGSFGEIYNIQDAPGVLTINIYIDPSFLTTASEDDIARRFSDIALSSVNFLSQSPNGTSGAVVTNSAQPFVKVTRQVVSPTPVSDRLNDENATPPPY